MIWRNPSEDPPPHNLYVLGYAADRPWFDGDDDPKRVVVKLRVYPPSDYRAGKRYWDTFGPDRFSFEEITEWARLPDAPSAIGPGGK